MLTFNLGPRRIIRWLLVIIAVLALVFLWTIFAKYYLGNYPLKGLLRNAFAMGKENNIPTWFSSLLLLFAAILSGCIWFGKKSDNDSFHIHWGALAWIFLFLSIDEAASIHEALGNVLGKYVHTSGYFYYTWVILGLLFVAIFGLTFFRFVLALPAQTRLLFVLAGVIYVGGAIGMEMLAAPCQDQCESFGFELLVLTEEVLEMCGISLFIYALIAYLADSVSIAQVRFQESI